MNSLLVVSCLVAFSAANPIGLVSYDVVGSIPNPNYEFNYAVNDPSTGDNKAQWETREGNVVRGAYSLVEPDGNVRVVEYIADSRGFNAVVKRSGPNVHPVSLPVAKVAQVAQVAPIAVAKPIIEPVIAPIAKPIYEPLDDIEAIAPIGDYGDELPIVPIIEEPIIAPLKSYDYNIPYGAGSPLVTVTGKTYGSNGNLVQRWTAGGVSLEGKGLRVKTIH